MNIDPQHALSYLIRIMANLNLKNDHQAEKDFIKFLNCNPQPHFTDRSSLISLEKIMDSMKHVLDSQSNVEILLEIAGLYQILS